MKCRKIMEVGLKEWYVLYYTRMIIWLIYFLIMTSICNLYQKLILISCMVYIKFATKFVTPRRNCRRLYKIYYNDQRDALCRFSHDFLSLHPYIRELVLRYQSEILHTFFSFQEAVHLSIPPISDHYSIYLLYKVNGQNKFWYGKLFVWPDILPVRRKSGW